MTDINIHEPESGVRTLAGLAAKYGTPLFVYDEQVMAANVRKMKDTIGPKGRIFYSVKANPNPALIRTFSQLGCSMEVASRGELELVLHCGIEPGQILYAGPGKTDEELRLAVQSGILVVNVESWAEILRLEAICQSENRDMDICLRINMNLSQFPQRRELHWFGVNQFGIDEDQLPEIIRSLPSLKRVHCVGVHLHTASEVLDANVFAAFIRWAVAKSIELKRVLDIRIINLGGGWGQTVYADDPELDLDVMKAAFQELVTEFEDIQSNSVSLFVESGRFLIGSSGHYLSRVVNRKTCRGKDFIIMDGGTNQCLFMSNAFRFKNRPVTVLYLGKAEGKTLQSFEITGSLCTPIDRLASDVLLPDTIREGDILAFPHAGAYTKMASPLNFLGHSWPAEVLVGGTGDRLIAKPVSMMDIIHLQSVD